MIKIVLTLLLLTHSLWGVSTTQKQRVAIKMLDAMNKTKQMDKMMVNIAKMQIAQNPILRMHPKKVMHFFLRHSSFQKLKPQLARLYAKELSVAEMQTFTAFCKSKEGQKILAKMPRLLQLSSNLGQQNLQKHYPELLNSLMK